ncbi:phytoene desaturase family protein [Bacteroidia bacterium]|nr:phytoene desaturase family protein [Bacteroidia bacterium]MDC1395657.1 phytoene desaturase family protein [Bacteroidia bacterium]
MSQNICVIGSGFSSLSAACYLAKQGNKVTVLEKNTEVGGRARQMRKQGFNFDMGPTFYWMPDVFESFFQDFGHSVSDFYQLDKLNPAYQIYYDEGEVVRVEDELEKIVKTFEEIEKGSGAYLKKYIAAAENNYNLVMADLVYMPGQKITEIITLETVKKIGLFMQSIKTQVRKKFKHPKLRQILEFPVLFLGATPGNTPAFYNFMNYADFGLGTWHPRGGMFSVVLAMKELGESLGITFITDCAVEKVITENKSVTGVQTTKGEFACDVLLSGADYNHTEKLLPAHLRQYSDSYWARKSFAPSALMFYVGIDKKLINLAHHTLFFDADFELHAEGIYKTGKMPSKPLFYASFPSMTDDTIAPDGKEAAIFLIPLAPDSEDGEAFRKKYFDDIIERLEALTEQSVKEHILFNESYSVSDFKEDYNAYKGNAYGLANTLLQTHVLRPGLKSTKLDNMYFTGQLTVPGPGVPPSIISGKIVSELITKYR